jgi:hypothetical protein
MSVRWSSPEAHVEDIPRFTYRAHEYDPDVGDRVERTSGEKYREAIRVTNMISSELAEIEDDEEFDELLQFVVAQWRNVRQRKRVRVSSQDDVDIELSQPHSLYCADLGDVSHVDVQSVVIDEPASQVVMSQSQQVEMSQSQHIQRAQDVTMVDEEETKGDDQHMMENEDEETKGNDKEETKENDDEETKGGDEEEPVGSARGADPADALMQSDDDDFESPTRTTMRFNPKKGPGRPLKDTKRSVATIRQDRTRFNAAMEVRRRVGEVSMIDLVASVVAEAPPLHQVVSRLACVGSEYLEFESKRPTYARIKNPVLNQDAFYILPNKLLQACVKKLPLGNSIDDAISIASQSLSEASQSQSQTQDVEVECVKIAGVCIFSRSQIETMSLISNLRVWCQEGIDFCRWLENDVASDVPAVLQQKVREIASQVKSMIPIRVLPGFAEDWHAAMLYRFQPPKWFNNALIRATCERIRQAHPSARMVELGAISTRPTAANAATSAGIGALAKQAGVEYVLVPVNIANSHWCGLIVDTKDKTVRYYDSMNSIRYGRMLRTQCEAIVDEHLPDFTVLGINSPIQQDGYSCGFFVSMKFWRHVDRTVSGDMLPYSASTRRFELLHFILTGTKA